MLHIFNQDKFNKQIDKAFNYLSKFFNEDTDRIDLMLNNKNLRDFAIYYNKRELSNIKANELWKVDSVEEHLRTIVDKLPDGRNKWTQNNVYHFISLYLLAYYNCNKPGQYDQELKKLISEKYNIPKEKLTDRVNKFINETLTNDKYGLLKDNLFTFEKLHNFQLRK